MAFGGRSGGTPPNPSGPPANENVAEWGGVAVEPAAPKADGQSNDANVPEVGARLQIFNGLTWDRVRAGAALGAALVDVLDRAARLLGHVVVDASALPVGAATEATLATRASEATLATRLSDATFTARINTLGQKVMAASTPVVIASDQSAVPISDGGGSITVDTPQLPAALVGGRLDENIGAWFGSTAPTVGQKAAASSIPVVLASDQPPVTSTTGTTSSVASSATSVQLLASNASRRGAAVVNDGTEELFVKCGTTASATDYTVKLGAGEYWEVPFGYTGRIDGIWDTANGSARLTEFT